MPAGHASSSDTPPTASKAEVYAPTAKNATAPRFTRPVSPHWTFRPSVTSARTPTRVRMAVMYAITPASSRARAGEAARPYEQHGQDDHEADRGLVGRRHEERPGFLHDTHDHRSREGARRRADSPQDGGGKDRDDEATAHQRVDAGGPPPPPPPPPSAPARRPAAEPIPPRMAAAKTEMMRPPPINGSMLASRPRKTPAPPAKAPPPRVAAAITRSGGRPLTGAGSGLSAV